MNSQILNIALPEELVKKVDEVAKKEYRNRSELIREALRVYLEDRNGWQQVFALGEKAMQEEGVTSENNITKIVSEYRHGQKL